LQVRSHDIIDEVLHSSREQIGHLYKLVDIVATIDMLRSFAEVVARGGNAYLRPQFGEAIALKEGRHPVLHKLTPATLVSNDTYLCQSNTLQILQGPNMSGK
jgi:DNA mismatch repair ATPase MutS